MTVTHDELDRVTEIAVQLERLIESVRFTGRPGELLLQVTIMPKHGLHVEIVKATFGVAAVTP